MSRVKTYAVKAIRNHCGSVEGFATIGEKGAFDFNWRRPEIIDGTDLNSAHRVLEECNATLPHWQLCRCKFEVIEL